MAGLSWCVMIVLALFSNEASASHFRGGTVSWRYLGHSGSHHNVEFNYRFGWAISTSQCNDIAIQRRSPTYSDGSWQHSGLSSYSSTNQSTAIICTANDVSEGWGFGYNSFVATITTSGPFHLTYSGNAWISATYGGNGWSLNTGSIDIGVRSDTRRVNNPPVALNSPVVKLIQGCAQVVPITHRDIDGDRVTCRYAVAGRSPDECSSACNGPSSRGYSHFTLNEIDCSIRYDGGGGTGLIAVSLVLSDHPKTNIVLDGSRSKSTSSVLSEIPLQFLMKIEPSSGSCNGIPSYPKESIQDGDQYVISTHGMLNRTIFAYASLANTSITQFVVLGPVGLFVSSAQDMGNNLYSAYITWHPGINEIGAHDVCYYASDSARHAGKTLCFTLVVSNEEPCAINNGGCSDVCNTSGLYISCSCSSPCWSLYRDEATCIPNMTVSCDRGNMTIAVAECAANGTVVVGDSLNDISQEQCQSTLKDRAQVLNIESSTCGVRYKASPFQIQFDGKMWLWHGNHPQRSIITRGEYRIVPLRCTVSLTSDVSANFVPELPFNNESFPVDTIVEGFGEYSFFFEFYKEVQFTSVVPPYEYPMSVKVNDRFYFSLGAIGRPGFVFSTRECKATTSSADPRQLPLSYTFLQDGCFLDSTLTRIASGNPMEERFSMKAFDFGEKITSSRESADISLQCKVMLCDSRNITSRCYQGCVRPSRKKRSASEQFDLIDDDDDESPMRKHQEYSESPLQDVKGRFILVADPELFDEASSSESPHHLYYALIGIGSALIAIALFVSCRVLHLRRISPHGSSTHSPRPRYKAGNVRGGSNLQA